MRSSLRSFFSTHPFASGIATAFAAMLGAICLTAAANHVHPFITGTTDYEDSTTGPIIEGVQDGSGIGIEGVADTDAPAGAIGVDGFGTSTTEASVGVNGSVDGPGSTALIGNANDTSGAASIGLEGFSANGEGVFAQSTNSDFASLRSVDANLFYDVRLSDAPNGNTVTAMLNTNSGGAAIVAHDTFSGASDFNAGIIGVTNNGIAGVEGFGDAAAADGVFGDGFGSDTGSEGDSSSGIGVLGSSNTGFGVEGESTDSIGAEGTTSNPSATTDTSEAGVFGDDTSIDGGTLNAGVSGASSSGIGVLATGADAMVADCASGGADEYVGKSSVGTTNFTVSCAGTVGTVIVTRHDLYANATVARTTESTLEDYGQGELVNGTAIVTLDPAFSEAISDRSTYLVFLTPDGDSRGLYVAQKTLHGFVVHENEGGRSTLEFDYRIVARPAGDDRSRMALSAEPPTDRVQPSAASIARTMASHRAALARFDAIHATALKRRAIALAIEAKHQPKRLPLYEPHMGADGKLHPGQPYDPRNPQR
ncbi:MAG TPA: hypothetical protein VEJ20_04200 [Candidatus Eremiobacteraceae bacterium]|nr:hypothetical protein [Candidatus Eremiobacteraceae bacterium]